jgi:serine/threonine protein kinase
MGAVFRAEDPTLQREIALKVMLPEYAADPDSRARFIREARAQAKVHHEHVVAIFQVGEDREIPYLAMPLLKGMTLQAALQANSRPPISEVLRVGREIAEGLSAAHEQGLIHRDIKPANIWLEGKRLRVRILDFGIARITGPDGSPRTQLTGQGMILGTPAYMSPEQARNQTLDGRSDLFSLGIILYEMCTGVQPFTGETLVDLLTALATEEPRSPLEVVPGLPPALSVLVMRLLSKKPAGRPQSAEELVTDIRGIEAMLGMSAAIPHSTPSSLAQLPMGPDPFDAFVPARKATEFNLVESGTPPVVVPQALPASAAIPEALPVSVAMPVVSAELAAAREQAASSSRTVKGSFPVWPVVVGVLLAVAALLWVVIKQMSPGTGSGPN